MSATLGSAGVALGLTGSILGVLTLGVSQGTTITVRAEGPQAEAAVAALSDLVDRDFGE